MDPKTRRDEINHHFNQLNEKLNAINSRPDEQEIPQIEIDIILEKLRNFYEFLQNPPVSKAKIIAEPREKVEIVEEEKPIKEEKHQENAKSETVNPVSEENLQSTEETPVMKEEPIESIPAITEPEPEENKQTITAAEGQEKAQAEIQEVKEETQENNHTDTSSSPDLFSMETSSIGESIKKDEPSLYEKMGGENQEKDLAARLSDKPIEDIKNAIGINEKFLFINELFKGDLQKYNTEIDRINDAENKDNAFLIVSELFKELHWNDENPAFEKLISFINRRF